MEQIKVLCRRHTDLSEADMEILERYATALQTIADMEEADIFLDCPTRDGDAIVVAEAKPKNGASAYRSSVVGMMATAEHEPAVARTFRLGVATRQMKAVTQERSNVIQTVEPIRNYGRVIGVLIREKRDDCQMVSPILHLSEQSMQHMTDFIARVVDEHSWLPECIDEALLIVSNDGVITFRNTLARDLYRKLGYVEDILGKRYENFRLIDQVTTRDEELSFTAVELKIGAVYLVFKRIPIHENGIAFAILMTDTTFKHEQEQQLILKSVAIKEMHHRVKNNLQTIASLLRLQTRRTDQESTRQVLYDSMNRILAIAATHELLACSGVDEIMLGEVIVHIKNNAVRFFAPQHLALELTVEGDDFRVDSDIATSVALVINELLQNSLKYAFTGRESGAIRIIVTYGELYSQIQVIDDGCGFQVSQDSAKHLGLNIVETLVRDKLHGRLSIQSDSNGTCVTFDFKKNKISDLSGTT